MYQFALPGGFTVGLSVLPNVNVVGSFSCFYKGKEVRKVQRFNVQFKSETALQGTLVLAESGRLEFRDNILLIL